MVVVEEEEVVSRLVVLLHQQHQQQSVVLVHQQHQQQRVVLVHEQEELELLVVVLVHEQEELEVLVVGLVCHLKKKFMMPLMKMIWSVLLHCWMVVQTSVMLIMCLIRHACGTVWRCCNCLMHVVLIC